MTTDAFPSGLWADEETHTSPDYHHDNSHRSDSNALVIQLTVSGEGFIRGPAGISRAPANTALLFTHRESTTYGYPADATVPYVLRYITLSPTPDLVAPFNRLHQTFGPVIRLPEDSPAASAFARVFHHIRQGSFPDQVTEAEQLYGLMIECYREQTLPSSGTKPIEHGYRLISDRFRQPITLAEIAATVGISREHFIREFSRRYHESPGTVLRRRRLEHARTTLRATGVAVEDIAVACGFTSSNSLCRAYRAYFGVTPGSERARQTRPLI